MTTYPPRLEPLQHPRECDCGHRLTDHRFPVPGQPMPCKVCLCPDFKDPPPPDAGAGA